MSSGFLVHKGLPELVKRHIKTIKTKGKSILLLPSKDIKKSTQIIVERQLKRGFGLNRKREEEKIKERFPIYNNYGDIKIFSNKKPEKIVGEIMRKI